jgi:serine/threonine-protein kinase
VNADDVIARRYRLVRLRGRGGSGEVWEAEDRAARTRVAVKVFLEGSPPPATFLARLRHPSLVRYLDRIEAPGVSALTMELADHSLAARLRRARPGPDDAVALLRVIAGALAHLHGLAPRIVHGDLKPDNVLLFAGAPRLGDVGVDVGAGLSTPMTLAYAAPERWVGAPVAPAAPADVYAFGVMAHELLAGALPFEGSIDALDRLHRTAPPPPLPASVPALLAELIDLCLAKDPAARPSAPDLVATLAVR